MAIVIPDKGNWRFLVGACNEKANVDATGQDSTHVMHPVHSTVLTLINWSTGMRDGQFLAHFPQSMQLSTFRRILTGENRENIPSNAP